MKISVAMATYNGERFIWDQLLSLQNQTLRPNNIIISDDGSVDETVSLIEKFQRICDIPIHLHSNDSNVGYTQNFETAFSLSNGDFIFPCDQDDVWFPDKIEKMVQFAVAEPKYNVYACDVMLTDDKLNSSNITKLQLLKKNGLSERHHGMGCATLVRGEFLRSCLPFPKRIKGHDNWINSIAYSTGTFIFSPQVLQYYRRHENITSSISSNSFIKNKYFFNFDKFKNFNISNIKYEFMFFNELHKKLKSLQDSDKVYTDKFLTEFSIFLLNYEKNFSVKDKYFFGKLLRNFNWCLFYYPKFMETVFGDRPRLKECIKRLLVLGQNNEA